MSFESKGDPKEMVTTLTDDSLPLEHRMHMTAHMCMDHNPTNMKAMNHLFNLASRANGEALYEKKIEELSQLLDDIRNGPLRSAMFFKRVSKNGHGPEGRIKAVLEDGTAVYPVVPHAELRDSLKRGELILLDAKAGTVLGRDPDAIAVGDEARFERRLDEQRVEVVLRDHEPCVFYLSTSLSEQIDSCDIRPGSTLLVDIRRRIAVDYVAPADGMSHYMFLLRQPVPNVKVSRDVANPPAYIAELIDHVRICMQPPELRQQYKVRMSKATLLHGVPGTGKTFSIDGLWRELYVVMSEITGISIEDLPPKVFKFRTARVNSKWFNESERLIDRFWDEVLEIAAQPLVGADGRKHPGLALVIAEEFEAAGRTRGTGDPISERIQATALERMDLNSPQFQDVMVLLVASTNTPHMVDPAWLRRVGGTAEKFGRINRQAFTAVLQKQLHGMKFKAEYGEQARAERRVCHELADYFYARNGSDLRSVGQVDITYVGSATPETRYASAFMTPALIDRAVQDAGRDACRAELHGSDNPGVSTPMLISSIEHQLRAITDQLTPENAHHYLEIPDAARVGRVRRLERPPILPPELERVSYEQV